MHVYSQQLPSPGRGPRNPLGALVLCVAATVAGCVSPPLESPHGVASGSAELLVPQNPNNQVDILFMVDNSNSMEAMQQQLKDRFPQFFKPFQDLADTGTFANLHVGVVTSDYGAGATGAPGCSPSPGGQMGKLQALGAKAASNCKKPVGANYIAFNFDPAKAADNNLPANQNLIDTFTCMASVGDGGCGFEHQLESVYAALRNNLPENAGFLRDEAMLVVVFLTNEDDASAPPDSDIFDKNQTAKYGYEDSYSRQTRFGIVCGTPGVPPPYGDSGGPLANCVAASNPPGREFDIARYMTLFNAPQAQGGVKLDPIDVVLIGVDAPEDPFQVILANPSTPNGVPYQSCGLLNESSNPPCVPVLQHSCQNPQQPAFFGDPAVRLNAVIRSAKNYAISSICDADYSTALDNAARRITDLSIASGCIPSRMPPAPDCKVEDLTLRPDGTRTSVELPACDGATFPCWKLETKRACARLSPDSLGLTVDRNGATAPPHTTARISCATLP